MMLEGGSKVNRFAAMRQSAMQMARTVTEKVEGQYQPTISGKSRLLAVKRQRQELQGILAGLLEKAEGEDLKELIEDVLLRLESGLAIN
jgi:hypothetical protein